MEWQQVCHSRLKVTVRLSAVDHNHHGIGRVFCK